MKRRDLVQKIEEMGCVLIRNGGSTTGIKIRDTRMAQPVPRHREINEFLAKSILKKLS